MKAFSSIGYASQFNGKSNSGKLDNKKDKVDRSLAADSIQQTANRLKDLEQKVDDDFAAITMLLEELQKPDSIDTTEFDTKLDAFQTRYQKSLVELQKAHDEETDCVLTKLVGVTQELTALSEESDDLEDLLNAAIAKLGKKFDVLLTRFDFLAQEQAVSRRSINLLERTAQRATGAIDKLAGLVDISGSKSLGQIQNRLSFSSNFISQNSLGFGGISPLAP